MKILIACEESATVREAFKAKGHDAWSCDIEPTRIAGQHLQQDVLPLLKEPWDMVIAFPPCTYLTVTANKWYKPEFKDRFPNRPQQRIDAIAFFLACYNANAPKVVVENPIGIMSTQLRKPDQIIQPFHYGHAERKSTCLWLKGVPKLVATNVVEPVYWYAAGKRYSPTHYSSTRSLNRLDSLPPGKDRSKLRSTTYPGIANAMADQWG